MLAVLLHGEVGEISVVVTRYFGGVKLGSGGLVRAYQGMAKLGLAGVPRRPRPFPAKPPAGPLAELEVIVGYKRIAPVKRLLPAFSARIEEERFEADAVLRISLPEANATAFAAALTELTEGEILTRPLQDAR
jgi:putative IMPACT (imprinted ancient) family translation regulator